MMVRYFEADERCPGCHALVLSGHEIFMFNNCPDAIRLHPIEEWQPSPEQPSIPMDNGPARVAYVWTGHDKQAHPDHVGEPVVAVHEGPKEGLYTVCTSVMSGDTWLWVCLPIAPKNPIDEDWIRSISS